ncbi:uncharacterized protein A4U43_C07F29930, partial [Asparagus officinalis]
MQPTYYASMERTCSMIFSMYPRDSGYGIIDCMEVEGCWLRDFKHVNELVIEGVAHQVTEAGLRSI